MVTPADVMLGAIVLAAVMILVWRGGLAAWLRRGP
jgi:hypothetical protein